MVNKAAKYFFVITSRKAAHQMLLDKFSEEFSMHILSLMLKTQENQKDKHFNATISCKASDIILLMMIILQFLNNFISKSEQFRRSTITFLLFWLKFFHFWTEFLQNLCFFEQMMNNNTMKREKSSYFVAI